MGSILENYRQWIRKDNARKEINVDSLEYWQNRVFLFTLEIFLPLWIIVMLFYNISELKMGGGFFRPRGFIVFFLLLLVCFSGKYLSVFVRKAIFLVTLYSISLFIILFAGPHGPGIMLLLAATIFGILFFSPRLGYTWSLIDTAICLIVAWIINKDMAPNDDLNILPLDEWFSIAFNLVFLSVLFSALLPSLIRGLGKSLDRQELLKQELIIKNLELEHFTYYVSHDLQQPLRTVAGFVKLLDGKYSDRFDEKGMEYLRHIKQGSEHMQHMIRELLNFSKAGTNAGTNEIIELKEVVEKVERIHQQQIEAKSASIHVNSNISILANRTCIFEVMQNLVENALKYSVPGQNPVVVIEGKENPAYWEISVTDNGIGIDPSYFDKIFVIFERLHGDGQYPGTGIGLALVKKIVNKLGGEVRVVSSPGNGSSFYFTIPRG